MKMQGVDEQAIMMGCMQEVEAVVERVQSLAKVLEIDDRHAQELATQEPRYSLPCHKIYRLMQVCFCCPRSVMCVYNCQALHGTI